jgi:hypothetical protein
MAGFTPQTVGEAQGLRAAPRDYTNQIIGAQRLKRQEEAAKKKQEEDEFAKLADIKVDYSKYHRLDRDRVKQMMAGYIGEMRKAYQSGNPNWRNIAYEKGSELKFDIEQAIVDSQQKFAFEKYYEDPNSLKTKQADAVYQWYKQGDFTTPPQIQIDEYGQINSVDPATGTYGFVPAKRYNLSTLANKSVFDPAIDGYETTTEGSTKLPTGEVVYKQRAIYNPEMIAGAISSLAGSQEFLGWKIDNGDRIRKEVAANADRPPEEVMYELWAEDIMKYGGDKFKETIQQENKGININMPQQEIPKYSTKFTSISNLLESDIESGNPSYKTVAKQLGGELSEKGTNVKIRIPESAVGKPVVVKGDRVFTSGQNGIAPSPVDGYTVGVPEQMQVRYGDIGADGTWKTYSEDSLFKMSPEEKKNLKPILLVAFRVSDYRDLPEQTQNQVSEDEFKKMGNVFFTPYNLSEGSFDLSDLNNQFPTLYADMFRKTGQEMGKEPTKSATAPKTNEPTQQPKPTKKKLY